MSIRCCDGPVEVVLCRCNQETAGGFVTIGERTGEADWRLLQSAPLQLLPAAWTLLWHQEAEDVLLTVSQSD